MKNLLVLYALLMFIGTSCIHHASVKAEELQGVWTLKKAKWYLDGKEVEYLPLSVGNNFAGSDSRKQVMEAMFGTVNDPAIMKFTKYGEVIIGVESAIEVDPEIYIHNYTLQFDTLRVMPNKQAVDITGINPGTLLHYITKLNSDTLFLVNERINPASGSKQVFSTYYTR